MTRYKGPFEPTGLLVNYKELGTVSVEEMIHAVVADLHAIRDYYNVRYVTGSRLKLFATNEYGEALKVYRPEGGIVRYLDTHHYRPSCKDYEL